MHTWSKIRSEHAVQSRFLIFWEPPEVLPSADRRAAHVSLSLSPRRNGWDTPSVLLAVIVVAAFFFACHFGSFLPSGATLLSRFLSGIGSEHSDLSTLA